MLSLHSLSVCVADKPVLSDISLSFLPGRTYYLLGKNGSGKSSLVLTLMGHPRYRVTGGTIIDDSIDILALTPEERSRRGWFLAFQNVPEITGIRLGEYLRTMYNTSMRSRDPEFRPLSVLLFRRFVTQIIHELGIPEAFLARDLHVGFSGGERRKTEILQMRLLDPSLIILDEIDSGLDIDALSEIGTFLGTLRSTERTFIIITHRFSLARTLPPDEVIILADGSISRRGDASLLDTIESYGFLSDTPNDP